jgi:hypothetical protein
MIVAAFKTVIPAIYQYKITGSKLMIDFKDIKLGVYAVLDEGAKLVFDVPELMQNAINVKPGDVIDLEQLILWHEIARAYESHKNSGADAIVDLAVSTKLVKHFGVKSDITPEKDLMQSKKAGKDSINALPCANLVDIKLKRK